MKKDTAIIKKLIIVAIVLVVVTISIIAFVGVYTKKLNKLSDVIPNYTFSAEFEGSREYQLTLDTSEEEKEVYIDENGNICGNVISDSSDSTDIEVTVEGDENAVEEKDETEIEGYKKETRTIKANEDDVLTPESYKKSKSIIENRLEKLGVAQYNIRLDEITGKLVVELPDDEDAAFIYSVISSQGKFNIIDSQTGLELMNNNHVSNASVAYNSNNGAYSVYLQIGFNKEGRQILEKMSDIYIEKEVEPEEKTEETETENTESEENSEAEEKTEPETKTDYIDIQMDGSSIMKTYFGDEKPNGTISIPIASNITDSEGLTNSLRSVGAIATLINTGKLPNQYTLQHNDYIQSTISNKDIDNIKIAFAIVIAILSIVLIIKFGLNGLIGAILNIGYLATVSIALRYTNVVVTISSIITAILVIGINFGFIYSFISKLKNDKDASVNFADTIKALYLAIIPVAIVAFVFTFMNSVTITGIGMILFWGLIIQALYNLIFVRSVYVLKDK